MLSFSKGKNMSFYTFANGNWVVVVTKGETTGAKAGFAIESEKNITKKWRGDIPKEVYNILPPEAQDFIRKVCDTCQE